MTALRRFLSNEFGLILVTACCYLAVSALALTPSSSVPHLPVISDKVQHIVAFLAIGFLTAASAASPFKPHRIGLAVVVFAAALELSQLLSPTRTVEFADFVASAVGGVVGVLLGLVARRWPLRLTARTAAV
jgi:VanZ family protein